jgi:hypothetical protein
MNDVIKFIAYKDCGEISVLSALDFSYLGVDVTHSIMVQAIKNSVAEQDFIGAGVYSARSKSAQFYGDDQKYAQYVSEYMGKALREINPSREI